MTHQLAAQIKRNSKYYDQTHPGEKFYIRIEDDKQYPVIGGPGGRYRLKDVMLFADAGDSGTYVKIKG